MVNVFIGIDVGTQGTKAIAYLPSSSHTKGKILARSSSSYNLLPNNGIVGRAEQDPNDWIIAVRYTLKELVSKVGLVAPSNDDKIDDDDTRYALSGIGISGQQHGMVLLDSNYKPLRPAKLWCDVEASDEAEWIQNSCGGGDNRKWNHVLPGFTAPKILWTIKNEPEIWKDVRWCVLPHDYVNLVLRGVHDNDDETASCLDEIQPTTDRGDASGSGVYNVFTNQFCMELTNAIDPTGRYAKALPTILEPLDICGSLSLQWMEDIGLLPDHNAVDQSSTPYIPISAGSGDNMCSALGVGCVEPGMAVLSLGTSGTIFGVSHSPPSSKVAPFADASGRYLPLVCIMSCTGILNSVLDSFFNGSSSDDGKNNQKIWTHEEATKLAMQQPAGCHGITFLPYLTPGERTPDWPHASGALLGLTASNMAAATSKSALHTDEDNSSPINPMAGLIYRAALEGITYLLAEGISTMKQACGDGFQPTCLLVVGGGSHNRLWRQMLADVLRIDLIFPKEKESAALGAAFQVGAAVEATKVTQGKSMEEYILRQSIEMEDEVICPTTDEETIKLYKDGKKRYCNFATKLFGDLN